MEFPTFPRGRALRRGIAAAAAHAAVSLVASGCALTAGDDDAASGSGSGGTESIAFVPKQLNNPYTDVVLGGGESASEDIGYDYSVVGPL